MKFEKNRLNQSGFSVIEMLVAGSLAAFIIGMTVTPIVQMKTLENKVEFQSHLTTAHQMALQKSRNSFFLKDPARLNIVSGNDTDKCFGGRGIDCMNFSKTAWDEIDTFSFTSGTQYSATSKVSIKVDCQLEKCTQVQVRVETTSADTSHSINTKPLIAQFNIPAAALSSRQEIDFSQCVGKVVTGINYATLKAECVAAGSNTCAGIAGAGPMLTFGPDTDPTDPNNCQVPVDKTCANGLGRFGLMNGQSTCAPTPICTDPFSTNCPVIPPTTVTLPCTPNWQPADNTVCLSQSFPQTDLNNCAPGPANRISTGNNAALCLPTSCTYSGTIKWPDATNGPCVRTAITLTAAPSSTTSVTNDNLGYVGTLTVGCQDLSPAANAFNWTAATWTCNPIKCPGVPVTPLQWSSTKIYDGTAGPWDCASNVTVNQSPAEAPGILRAYQIDGANATFTNVAPTATAGGGTITCQDPGPVGSPRSGVLTYSGLTCTSLAPDPLTWCKNSVADLGPDTCAAYFNSQNGGDTCSDDGYAEGYSHSCRQANTRYTYQCGNHNPMKGGTACAPNPAPGTCDPIGSHYLWSGADWQDMGSPNWNMSLIGGNITTPPPTYMDNPHDMGNGVFYYSSPPTMRCGKLGAPPAEPLCWSLDDAFMGPWIRQCTVHGSCTTEGAWNGGKCINSSNGLMEYPTGTNGDRVQCVKASLGRCNVLAAAPVVNGACGPASGAPAATAPSANLCNSGTPTAVSGSGPYTWTCNGESGGSSANCATTAAVGSCGPTNGGTLLYKCQKGTPMNDCMGAGPEAYCACPLDGRWAWLFGAPDPVPASPLYVPGGIGNLNCAPVVKNVCYWTSDTAAIGDGELTVGEWRTIPSQLHKGGFDCHADPAANVQCVYDHPPYNYFYSSCSEITLGNIPAAVTCELQTFRCVPK